MKKQFNFEIKEKMIQLAGSCFWYWDGYHSFLINSGVPRPLIERFPKEAFNKYQVMRNVLNGLEEQGRDVVLCNLVSSFYRMKQAVDKDKLDNERAKSLLREFRESVGNDPIEVEIQKREIEKKRIHHEQTQIETAKRNMELVTLNDQFNQLAVKPECTPQERGFKLETLFFDLLKFSEIICTKPYRTPNGEQIDGHFQFEKFDYLVESKWIKGLVMQKDLSIFDGKIRGKAQSTRGLFLAAEGFDENGVNKFTGDAPRIILMTGADLALILNGTWTFMDAMSAKLDAIVRYGDINFPVSSIRN